MTPCASPVSFYEMNLRVQAAFCLEETPAARQHEIGPAEELLLERDQPIRGVGERGELVHAVVDDSERSEPARACTARARAP